MARKVQQELSFDDSTWIGDCNPDNPISAHLVHQLGQLEDVTELTRHQPLPESKRGNSKVICLECSRKFSTRSFIPTCPGCGGSDVEPAF